MPTARSRSSRPTGSPGSGSWRRSGLRRRRTKTAAPDRAPRAAGVAGGSTGRSTASQSASSVGLGARQVSAGPGATADREHRLFIAVPVPEEVRLGAARLIAAAGPAADTDGGRGVRWVGEDAFHLTLRFLGATPADRVAAAAEAVAEAARASRPFPVSVGRSGAFPRASAPRTLWLGIEEGGDALATLASAVERALAVRGWPGDDRPFRAHLTLGRCEDALAGGRAAEALAAASARFRVAWRVETLVLFESHLGRGPARYAVVTEHPLGG